MSLVLRGLVARHRRTLVKGPGGLIHARDDLGVVHGADQAGALLTGELVTFCGEEIMSEDGLAVLLPPLGPVRSALTCTWDPIDCVACLAKGSR